MLGHDNRNRPSSLCRRFWARRWLDRRAADIRQRTVDLIYQMREIAQRYRVVRYMSRHDFSGKPQQFVGLLSVVHSYSWVTQGPKYKKELITTQYDLLI